VNGKEQAKSVPALDAPEVVEALEEYLEALERGEAPNQQAFLARHADLAGALAECLDGLEALHSVSSSTSPSTAIEAAPPEASLGTPLGDFRILREIGRGGMGVVYEAEQLSLGRRVALKVLPFAAAMDARQLQRFKNEAHAAAHLHHPNIVPVYAVGCERGVHYYAMQLIEGQNLASLIEGLRGADRTSSGPTRPPGGKEDPRIVASSSLIQPLSALLKETRPVPVAQRTTQRSLGERTAFFRMAARLAVQAAAALEHAHGLGVIHRDVKPANLLVDPQGNAWITDFGLAQLHDDTGLTQSGDLLGTLRYMSPEQAAGQRVLIDHRTDVYSLGATLYELLTLRPIFDGNDRQKLLNQIIHEEPRPLRSVDRSIPTELETIVLKAVAKAPAERYATAQELIDDLQRFLEDRPIRARRPSVLEKTTKWARRHRGVVASAVAALLLLVAGLSVATVLTARAYDRERQKAREADEQRARAEESFRQARQAVNQLIQIGEDELAGNPALEGIRRRLLEVALAYYQDFINQRHNEPGLQAELEVSRAEVETILRELIALMGSSQYGILHHQAVQAELRLTEDQREALGEIRERWREAFHESRRLGAGERERRLRALALEQEDGITKLFSTAQMRRFKQIALQQRGSQAFSDQTVVSALALTPEQKKRIREIQDEERSAPPRFGSDPRRPGQPDRSDRERKRARKKLLDLLAADQRRKWDELIGEPFEVEIHSVPHRPFGPSRGPGQ
jgi:serine/threonine protein kinase